MVLDASALLAMLLHEPGADRVKSALDGGRLCAVNLAEVVSYFAKLGGSRADIEALLKALPLQIDPVDTGLSYAAGMLSPSRMGFRSEIAIVSPWQNSAACPF